MLLKREQELLAECVYKEARGEGLEGMEAVAHVIVNRTKAWKQTLTKTILGKNQFSCMSVPSDPQFGKPCPAKDDPQGKLWAAAQEMVERILGEMPPPDPTGGALYYANLKTMDKGGWFERNIVRKPDLHPVTVKVKNHTFFR
jgi:spore germination cell wall hydrolase CwlJ-like protein